MSLLNVSATRLSGVKILQHHKFHDQRGEFTRLFCRDSLLAANIDPDISQINFTRTRALGTVRGLHFQREPFAERKIISCVRGAVFDVIVDVREGSATRWQWQAFELNETAGLSLLLPAGFAHGFQSLTDDVEMLYLHDQPYVAEAQTGLRYSDPTLAISWPLPVTLVSEKDAAFALITPTDSES
jgi:dTDP-4-dehydrorhamnose 3,5-epimerase